MGTSNVGIGQPTLIEVFEDFLCPACADLYHFALKDLMQAYLCASNPSFSLKVIPVNLLDSLSRPAGYSTLSARVVVGLGPDKGLMMRSALYSRQPGFLSSDPEIYSESRIRQLGTAQGLTANDITTAFSMDRSARLVNEGLSRLRSLTGPGMAVPAINIDGVLVPPKEMRSVISRLSRRVH